MSNNLSIELTICTDEAGGDEGVKLSGDYGIEEKLVKHLSHLLRLSAQILCFNSSASMISLQIILLCFYGAVASGLFTGIRSKSKEEHPQYRKVSDFKSLNPMPSPSHKH